MLFSELLEGQTWTYARIALRRIGKDRRARRFLGSMLGLLLTIPFVLLALAAALGAMAEQPMSIGPFALLLGFAARFIVSAVRRENRYWASFHEQGTVPETARRNILRTAYWLAVLLQRLDSEIYLQKEIPPEIQIITRRVLLDRLKAQGIWEEMPIGVRDLLLKPDGHWSAIERDFVAGRFEFLRCLRWLVRKDTYLRWLSLLPEYDLRDAREVVEDAGWFELKNMVSAARLEERCQIAFTYVNRCWLEGVARGLVTADPEQQARAVEQKKNIDPNADFLLGNKSVGAITDNELQRLFQRSHMRANTLRIVQNEMTLSADKGTLQKLIEDSFQAVSSGSAQDG